MSDLGALTLNESDFNSIQKLVLDNTGISLSSAKKELVKRRFTPRIKELGLSSFGSYIKHFKDNYDSELSEFSNAITTNLTSFFREKHHYDFLKKEALPIILKRNSASKRLRVWSAGCSSGQEAYCLAMILRDSIPNIDSWDVKILATDLDEKCLSTAKEGSYSTDGFDKVSESYISKYFKKDSKTINHGTKDVYTAKNELKQLITFNKLNLMNEWPMKGDFDVIFCRNVFIYFDKDVQLGLIKRYAKLQKQGSYLCLGHSETISNPSSVGYRLMGKTLYIRE